MEKYNSAVIQRIRIIMNQLGMNQSQMAVKTNIRQPNLSAILRGKRSCDEAIINKICISLDISKSWLLTGDGQMLRSPEGNASPLDASATSLNDVAVPVRYFEVNPTATFQEFCAGSSERPSFINIVPPPDESLDESFCVFEISGESMAPQIQPHARVLCQEVPPTRWHTLADCVVVIAYADRFVIKRVIANKLQTESYLELASDNPEYPHHEFAQLCDIRAVFRARRIISSQIF